MSKYKTPGVYVEEISVFPPSVAQVETAIPAFVGYTQKAELDGLDLLNPTLTIRPIKISSLPEFELIFGGAPDPLPINVVLNDDNSVRNVTVSNNFLLYDTVRMFYDNGGGDCYVVSVGDYDATIGQTDLRAGLDALEKFDEPTLIVIPESVRLTDVQSGSLQQAMLSQCNKLGDRFAIMDLINGDQEIGPSADPSAVFRTNVGMNHLKYGAAYYPWLNTTLPFNISFEVITSPSAVYSRASGGPMPPITELFNQDIVQSIANMATDITAVEGLPAITDPAAVVDKTTLTTYANSIQAYALAFHNLNGTLVDSDTSDLTSARSTHNRYLKGDGDFHNLLKIFYDLDFYSDQDNDAPNDSPWSTPVLTANNSGSFADPDPDPLVDGEPAVPFDFSTHDDTYKVFAGTGAEATAAALPYYQNVAIKLQNLIGDFHAELEAVRQQRIQILYETDNVYSGIVDALRAKGVVLPPSGAMAGIYAAVDNARGVWKAPANVSVSQVKGPAVNVTHEEQEGLNVDVVAGKSINAIRAFTGKGTMVWGARTLAGNDNEWRYVPVRRFFNMVEESVKKATEQFVFEPNDANTWIKVRAMIENFLTLQWRAGALQGAKAEQAFFVRVGLGETMTSVDILEGRMNVEIGMAVVRPAEFIILKFSHKMAEA